MTDPNPYTGPEWKAVRLLVLARDGYQCQLRYPKCRSRANHADHIIAVSQGGARLDPANLQAACASCNVAKRNREVAARARGEAPAGVLHCRPHAVSAAVCGGPHSQTWGGYYDQAAGRFVEMPW